jgi:hypothetical protein
VRDTTGRETARKRHCMKRAQQRETSHGDTEKEAVLGKQ